MKKKRVIIFLYNRLFDPLIQSNFWLYIQDYLDDEDRNILFYLITYEDPQIPITIDQEKLANHWCDQGLKWKKLKWNRGIGIVAKVKDILQGYFTILKLRFQGYRHVVSLASVAGTFVYLYSRLVPVKLFLYQFEPHSEYAIDNKMWSPHSFQYKLAHFLERKAALTAKVVASGTVFMEERLKEVWKSRAAFFKIPTVVNDKKFKYNYDDRKEIRTRLNIPEDAYVLYYPGKFGDLYYREEIAWMFKWLHEEESRLHFLIVTPHKDEEVHALFETARVEKESYTVTHSDYSDIHKYASASDFAVIAVPPGPSKKFISNIKVGEYLCAGLPYLITRGVSEDFLYAEREGIGVVVDDFKKEYIKAAWPEIERFLKSPALEIKDHCRKVGLEYRGFEGRNTVFKQAINNLIS